jgi:hypothetical protein
VPAPGAGSTSSDTDETGSASARGVWEDPLACVCPLSCSVPGGRPVEVDRLVGGRRSMLRSIIHEPHPPTCRRG